MVDVDGLLDELVRDWEVVDVRKMFDVFRLVWSSIYILNKLIGAAK